MKLLKQAFAVTGALFVLALALAFIAPQRVQAVAAAFVQIVPGGATHVGQYESNLVSLVCQGGADDCSQAALDRTLVANYTVPAGYTLVITDYEWLWDSPPFTANVTVCDSFFTANVVTPVESCALTDSNGVAGGREHLTAGVRVVSGSYVGDIFASGSRGLAWIQGYLVPND
jgi:hypothetical protein